MQWLTAAGFSRLPPSPVEGGAALCGHSGSVSFAEQPFTPHAAVPSQNALRDSGCHLDSSSDVELARELAEATCSASSDAVAASKLLLPDGSAIQVSTNVASV